MTCCRELLHLAPGATVRSAGPSGDLVPVGQGGWVLRAEDPLIHGQQRGVLVLGPRPHPRLPGPVGEAGAGVKGGRVLRASDRRPGPVKSGRPDQKVQGRRGSGFSPGPLSGLREPIGEPPPSHVFSVR